MGAATSNQTTANESAPWYAVVPSSLRASSQQRYVTVVLCFWHSQQVRNGPLVKKRARIADPLPHICAENSLVSSNQSVSTDLSQVAESVLYESSDQLSFPSVESCMCVAPVARITVPDIFLSVEEYRDVFTAAVKQELNFRLRDVAVEFFKTLRLVEQQGTYFPSMISVYRSQVIAVRHRSVLMAVVG